VTETEAAADRSIIDLIIEDHRELQQLFARGQQTTDPDEFQRIVSVTIAELVRHAIAEEQHLYPAFREYLDDGDELADHEIAEHSEAEQTMKEMEGLDGSNPELRVRFNELVEEVTHHLEGEEKDALPRLRATCPHESLVLMGTKFLGAKRVAPTRPHPSAPDTPPLNKLLAPGTGLVDRVRDAVTRRPT
jgi:hemerythrin superfamily protein